MTSSLKKSLRFRLAVKLVFGYVSACLLVEMIKQYFVYKHESFLIKVGQEEHVKATQMRNSLREQLEQAVI